MKHVQVSRMLMGKKRMNGYRWEKTDEVDADGCHRMNRIRKRWESEHGIQIEWIRNRWVTNEYKTIKDIKYSVAISGTEFLHTFIKQTNLSK